MKKLNSASYSLADRGPAYVSYQDMKTLRGHLDGPELFELEVVGESHFQKNLQTILGRFGLDTMSDRVAQRATARILSEPTNRHDPNAVQVFIDDLLVGYVDRATAARIRKQLDKAGYDSIDATCAAIIVGGFNLQLGDVLYGVKLDIYTESQRSLDARYAAVSEFTFFAEPSDPIQNESLAYTGNAVNFWSSPNMPSRINIYCRGGISGEGKLGTVPKDYVIPIQRHLQAGLEFEAKIIAHSNQRWQIHCRLIPAEETAARVAEYASRHRERLQKELASPYRPRKPIQFTVRAESDDFTKGDVLEITELPSIEEMFTEYGSRRVLFRCIRSERKIEHRCDNSSVEKLIRLRIENNPLIARVTGKSRTSGKEIDFTIEIAPLAKKRPKT